MKRSRDMFGGKAFIDAMRELGVCRRPRLPLRPALLGQAGGDPGPGARFSRANGRRHPGEEPQPSELLEAAGIAPAFEQADKYDLVLDLGVARKLGVALPGSVLVRADKVSP